MFFRCVKRKEFNELKEEVRRLRKKIKDLTNVQLSESSSVSQSQVETPSQALMSPPCNRPPLVTPVPMSPPSNRPALVTPVSPFQGTSEEFNGYTLSQLEDSISHIDKIYEAVRTLMLKLFPASYIATHSVSGKASNATSVAKPCFDTRLYGIMQRLLKEKFAVDSKVITEKVHSVQKYVMKNLKKE